MEDKENIIGKNMKRIRKEKGLTQDFIREKIGRSHSSIVQYEHGHVPTPIVLKLIAEALEVTIEDLTKPQEVQQPVPTIPANGEAKAEEIRFLRGQIERQQDTIEKQ